MTTNISKRKFIQFAALTAVVGTASTLIGCDDSSSSEGKNSNAGTDSLDNTANPLMSPSSNEPLKVAFVYNKPIGDAGWTYAHDKGRLHIGNVFGDKIKTSYVENISDSNSERVFRNLVNAGNRLIFGTTHSYMEPMLRVASDYPDTYFEHCSGFKTATNMRVYDHRIYEAAYQAGIVAAYMSKTKVLGFIGSSPTVAVLRNVNSFALGAHSVDQEIKIKLVWTKDWYNPEEEAKLAQTLLNDGADVLLQNTDSPAVLRVAAISGHFAFGWGSDMEHYAPEAHLGSCVLNWGVYYEKAVNDVLNKTWKSDVNRWGTKEGLVAFIKLSDKVPSDAKQRILEIQENFKNGESYMFKGPIKDNLGNEKLAETLFSDDNWNNKAEFLIEGIEGTISSS